jgi:hypothetical protein
MMAQKRPLCLHKKMTGYIYQYKTATKARKISNKEEATREKVPAPLNIAPFGAFLFVW